MSANEFTLARLKKLHSQSHSSALEFIEIVTNAAGDQMQTEGISFDPAKISAEYICELAAKKLGVGYNELLPDYIELMLFEKMIEMA